MGLTKQNLGPILTVALIQGVIGLVLTLSISKLAGNDDIKVIVVALLWALLIVTATWALIRRPWRGGGPSPVAAPVWEEDGAYEA